MPPGDTFASSLPGPLALAERTAVTAVTTTADERRKARVERLVRDHHAFVWRTARRLGVRDADLDDVVQEVFLAAARNVEAIQHDRERGYLFQTCVFAAAHARRSVQRRREVVDEDRMREEIDRRASPEQNAAASQARARLQAILDAMPEDFRAVFVLFELERMTMAEIAQVLGLPAGTVASRLRRAREIFLARAAAEQTDGDAR